jgi:LysR family nitrogen assimilation transcriptional regulator
MLHLRDLHCFTLVYESRSFSRAADNLDTVQSMVSTRIQRLESFVGGQLFVRLHRGVVSTEKGEVLYQHAKRVLRDVAELESALRGEPGRVQRTEAKRALRDMADLGDALGGDA